MTNPTQYFLALLFIGLITSCNGQVDNDISKDNANQYIQNEKVAPDVDEYFVESEDVSSSYGPTSITRNILEDKDGNIWFASWEGIIRYDGESFVNFTNKEKLRRFHVFSLLEDSKGILWFGTIGAGVYRYDGHSFENLTTEDGLPDDRVTCIYEEVESKLSKEENATIWFGTTGGASRYDGESFENFTTEDGMSDHDINSIIEDRDGIFWFGTRGEACTYDPSDIIKDEDERFKIIRNKKGSTFNNVRSIIVDKLGNIWLGGNDGLWRYDGKSYVNYATDFVGFIFEDSKGNIWTNSAENGNDMNWQLSRYDAQFPSKEKKEPMKILQENDMFFGIMEDSGGDIWLGRGYGIYRYDGHDFEDFLNK